MNNKFTTDTYVDILNEALFLKRNGKYKNAIELTKEAILLEPNRELAYYNLGKILYITEQYDQSIKSYQKAIEFGYDPDQTVLHLGQSILAKNIKKTKDEILHIIYRMTIDPHFGRTLSSTNKSKVNGKISTKEYEQYQSEGISAAIEYMNSLIDK